MKKALAVLLCIFVLSGCSSTAVAEASPVPPQAPALSAPEQFPPETPEYVSRFDSETRIVLSDEGITVNGGGETGSVFTSHDILYYEDRDTYDSGNPYGEGADWEKHTAKEAAAHTVVNITAPGAYRLTGNLPAGQIRIDLGEDAYDDPDAVVELILEDADISCSVAPAILFLNVYECDGNWSENSASAAVDTSAAGANLILEGTNTISGSHVAKIFKDKDGEKKLWKQDASIYSYMSMNVFGTGSLELTADNEGIGTELHLTVNGGNIRIFSDNDGINTNEDGVSVTTINAGQLEIYAGLGAEGDGIDSNGYLVINNGIVFAAANPASDSGMDSDLGTYINGGTVIALGSAMNQPDSNSAQAVMSLQFSQSQDPGSSLVVTDENKYAVFSYTPDPDDICNRGYTGAILSSPDLKQGEVYSVCSGGVPLQHNGNISAGRPGGRPLPSGSVGNAHPERPEGSAPPDFTPPEGEKPSPSENAPPEGFDGPAAGNFSPEGMQRPPAIPDGGSHKAGQPSTEFHMTDMVVAFSGVTKASA